MTIPELYSLYLQYPSVQTDTRKLKPSDLFFALKGPNFNANEFAQQALEQGAAMAVIDDEQYSIPGKTIVVDDVLTTLQQLAKYHRQQFSIPFLAITGSNGKTTTKELIHAVLSTSFTTYTTEGNLNNHIGVPLTILKIKKDAEMAVIEMGANHQREIASYCGYTLPTHGLITNVGKAHLEGFGGEEGVRKGKGELFDYIRSQGGTVFLMNDYDYLQEMSQGIAHTFTYGTQDADVTGSLVQAEPFLSVRFQKGLRTTVQTQLVGSYNLPNVLAAAAVGLFFGVGEEKIKQAIESYQPSNSRSQLVKKGSNKIILDAYNANPSSMKAAIENFAHAQESNKILVLGAMAELGAESVAEHKAIVDEIKKYNWQRVLLVGGDFQKLSHPFEQYQNAEEAAQSLKDKVQDAYLLIKGSRSMKMEKVMEVMNNE
jgi:UDP-N-acetylmuramoyl-tripeptide--D-alanyl-D-alanine ligase